MRCLKFILFVLLTGTLVVACRQRGVILYVMVNRVDGLYKSSPVMYKGVKVGEVRRMKLLDDSVLVAIRLSQDLNIPQGSRFEIVNPLLGECSIDIEPSEQVVFLRPGDTARGSFEPGRLLENEWADSSRSSRNKQAMRQIIEGVLMLVDTTGKNGSPAPLQNQGGSQPNGH